MELSGLTALGWPERSGSNKRRKAQQKKANRKNEEFTTHHSFTLGRASERLSMAGRRWGWWQTFVVCVGVKICLLVLEFAGVIALLRHSRLIPPSITSSKTTAPQFPPKSKKGKAGLNPCFRSRNFSPATGNPKMPSMCLRGEKCHVITPPEWRPRAFPFSCFASTPEGVKAS